MDKQAEILKELRTVIAAQQELLRITLRGTVEQVIDILIAISHAVSGFLCAFANVQKLGPFIVAEHDMFNRLFKAATGDEWQRQDE